MIGRLIDWSARNIMLVLIATAFAVAGGIYALKHLPLDAIPDLSDTQVIVYTEYPGQAPQVVEDQVTYPLASTMLTVPKSKVVRGFSFFGVSFVYIIFEDGTDVYWARSRDGNVRDRDQSKAERAMAARRDHRKPHRRDGQGFAVSGSLQRLDHADQGAHRYARDRHPHPRWH
jgi:multidrug efflux pump subunit AcrB